MLIKLSVENFKSFNTRQELSLLSSSKIQEKVDHTSEIKGTKILKNAAIYGANASGKTNLIKVMSFIKTVLINGLPVNSSDLYCRNYKSNKDKISSFEIMFSIGEKFYAFGFDALLYKREIVSEWLYELLLNGKSKEIYSRDKRIIKLNKKIKKEDDIRFNIYADDFKNSDSDNRLFISEMNRNKDIKDDSDLLFFKEVYEYLTRNIVIINPNTKVSNTNIYSDKNVLKEISELMMSFDTGVYNIETDEITIEELTSRVPKDIIEDFLRYASEENQKHPGAKIEATLRSDIGYYCISIDPVNNTKIKTLMFNHSNNNLFNYFDESDGTKRLLDLVELIITKKDNMVFFVDELERSLHPKLTERFLELFIKAHKDRNVQLVFSTHENEIMDKKIFRRDEIWFAERQKDNSTKLYSLDMFKERYDKKISKAYLDGRYGALPIFKDFSFKEDD